MSADLFCVCGHGRETHTGDGMKESACTGVGSHGGGCACSGYTEEPVCDFCTSKPAPWTYPTTEQGMLVVGLGEHNEIIGTQTHISHADWAACEKCAALIEAGDQLGLARALIRELKQRGHIVPERAHGDILAMHRASFWPCRDGERYRHPTREATP